MSAKPVALGSNVITWHHVVPRPVELYIFFSRLVVFMYVQSGFTVASRPQHWCGKTNERRPYWFPNFRNQSSGSLTRTSPLVSVNQYGCLSREWKRSVQYLIPILSGIVTESKKGDRTVFDRTAGCPTSMPGDQSVFQVDKSVGRALGQKQPTTCLECSRSLQDIACIALYDCLSTYTPTSPHPLKSDKHVFYKENKSKSNLEGHGNIATDYLW